MGHPRPFFAPAAALIVLGQARGERVRRMFEVLIGVAVGILIADIVVRALGPHTTTTVVVVIVSTLIAAVALGAGPVLTVQASVSALYVAVVTPPGSSPVSTRFVDALVGGGIAVVLAQVRAARDPFGPVRRHLQEAFEELAETFDQIAAAMDAHSRDAARAALARARAADPVVGQLRSAARAAEEGLWLRARRTHRLSVVESLERAGNQADYAVRGARVLARASVTLTRERRPSPPAIATAVRLLGRAARDVAACLIAQVDGDDAVAEERAAASRDAAIAAVRSAADALEATSALPVAMVAGQIRMTAIDLLRAADLSDVSLLEQMDASLGLTDH